jgi:hypothetical protein
MEIFLWWMFHGSWGLKHRWVVKKGVLSQEVSSGSCKLSWEALFVSCTCANTVMSSFLFPQFSDSTSREATHSPWITTTCNEMLMCVVLHSVHETKRREYFLSFVLLWLPALFCWVVYFFMPLLFFLWEIFLLEFLLGQNYEEEGNINLWIEKYKYHLVEQRSRTNWKFNWGAESCHCMCHSPELNQHNGFVGSRRLNYLKSDYNTLRLPTQSRSHPTPAILFYISDPVEKAIYSLRHYPV